MMLGSAKQAEVAAESLVQECVTNAPAILLLRHMSFVTMIEKGQGEGGQERGLWMSALEDKLSAALAKSCGSSRVVIVGSSSDADDLTNDLRSFFTHEVALTLPDDDTRKALFLHHTRSCKLGDSVDAGWFVRRTKGCSGGDIQSAIARAGLYSVMRMERPSGEAVVECEDLTKAMDEQQAHSHVAGALKIPNVQWSDVGGLEQVKKDILDTVQLPLQHPELFSSGMKRRSGVLLFGPPGTGKTLLAKAVATECSLSFLSVKGPELINMYIGESERNVRQVFKRAAEAAPCVVFFDELDSLAPNRGQGADSGGVMDRVVSQLLAEMDGSASRTDVFVMGATNRPDLIDPALLRPGRFDKLLYCGLGGSSQASGSDHQASQAQIIVALTRKMTLSTDVDIAGIAAACPGTFTGADLYGMCADAWQRAAIREVGRLNKLQAEGGAPVPSGEADGEGEVGGVVVGRKDFEGAMRDVVPSVTPGMLIKYEQLRNKFA
mmetsp:Transcript_27469/g.69323  ORF Transcript_27469/g.69323 Transcript_27469/m.69323 type:complete len:493 (+) Transcript_27469:1190-2668(+)